MDDSRTYTAYLDGLTIAELRAERVRWSSLCKLWDHPDVPDWLLALAYQNLQACEAAFRQP